MNGHPQAASGIAIRPMQLADLPAVMELETAAYPYPWSQGVFADCLRAGYTGWLLSDVAQLIGYAVVALGADEAHLLNLCIAPRRQRQGHGDCLLRHLLSEAQYMGAQRIFLEVRPSNLGARRLYLRHGFVEIGRRPRYYPAADGREEAIVMRLEWAGRGGSNS